MSKLAALCLALLLSTGAVAQHVQGGGAVEESVCVFGAAERLPRFPDMTVANLNVEPEPSNTKAARRIVNASPDVAQLYRRLEPRFGSMSAKDVAELALVSPRSEMPQIERSRQILAMWLEKRIKSSMMVTFEVGGFGRRARYSYLCIVSTMGFTHIEPLGMS